MLVNIRETLERVVEADSVEEAAAMWYRGEIVLDAEDFKDVEFTKYEED